MNYFITVTDFKLLSLWRSIQKYCVVENSMRISGTLKYTLTHAHKEFVMATSYINLIHRFLYILQIVKAPSPINKKLNHNRKFVKTQFK